MTGDVADEWNKTTLGPYSFRVFVDCALTVLRFTTSKEVGLRNIVGRRAKEENDCGRKRKRWVKEAILKTANGASKAELCGIVGKKAKDENIHLETTESEVLRASGKTTRKRTKKNK